MAWLLQQQSNAKLPGVAIRIIGQRGGIMCLQIRGRRGFLTAVGLALPFLFDPACFAKEPSRPQPPAKTKPTWTLRGHGDGIFCVAFSPDRSCLASASRDRTIKLWDTSTGSL